MGVVPNLVKLFQHLYGTLSVSVIPCDVDPLPRLLPGVHVCISLAYVPPCLLPRCLVPPCLLPPCLLARWVLLMYSLPAILVLSSLSFPLVSLFSLFIYFSFHSYFSLIFFSHPSHTPLTSLLRSSYFSLPQDNYPDLLYSAQVTPVNAPHRSHCLLSFRCFSLYTTLFKLFFSMQPSSS